MSILSLKVMWSYFGDLLRREKQQLLQSVLCRKLLDVEKGGKKWCVPRVSRRALFRLLDAFLIAYMGFFQDLWCSRAGLDRLLQDAWLLPSGSQGFFKDIQCLPAWFYRGAGLSRALSPQCHPDKVVPGQKNYSHVRSQPPSCPKS